MQRSKRESHEYRKQHAHRFVKIGDKFSGFRRGVPNGPEPTTTRGKQRAKK